MTRTARRAGPGGIAALVLPPVAIALIGLFLLAREGRGGSSRSRSGPAALRRR